VTGKKKTYKKLLKDVVDGDEKAMAEARAIFSRFCEKCGVEIVKKRADQRFCCKKCRQTAAKR
jgi:ribosomal protein L37AE/L43A